MAQNPESDLVLMYTTFPDMAVATDICQKLVEERLAACANILPQMTAIYEWQGQLESEQECAVLLKTRRRLADTAMKSLKAKHPYETPAILILPVLAGDADYCEWLLDQTTSNRP